VPDDLTPDPELESEHDADSVDDGFEEYADDDSDEILAEDGEDEYEEITSDEVDRVVAALENLMDTVESENILTYLEYAANEVFYLVYTDDDLEDPEGTEADAA
jgi:hypothetical protein